MESQSQIKIVSDIFSINKKYVYNNIYVINISRKSVPYNNKYTFNKLMISLSHYIHFDLYNEINK